MTISMMDYMKDRGLIDDGQIDNIRKMLQEMTRYEMGAIRGNLNELAEGAGPIYNLFLRISGAQLGARASELFGGENKLIAGQAGSQAMRNIFENIPLTLNMDLVRKMMEDPKLLGTMLKKPKTDVEKLNWTKGFFNFLKGYGLNVSRRPLPGASREASEFFDEQLLDVMDPISPPPSEEEGPRPPLRREDSQASMIPPALQQPVTQVAPPEPRTTGPLSVQNNNPGNLRLAGQPGAVEGEGGFAAFASPGQGLRALTRQVVLDTQTRDMSLGDFLNKYAPPSENKTNQYIDFVERQTGLDAKGKVPESKIPQLVQAIVRMEGGQEAVDYFYGQPQRAEAEPPQRPPLAQAAPPQMPPAPPAPAPITPQSLARTAQVLGPQDEIGMLASELMMRQRPS